MAITVLALAGKAERRATDPCADYPNDRMVSSSVTLKITHVITGIRAHGAELALLRLIAATASRCDHHVVVITAAADLRDRFEAVGAKVTVVGLTKRRPSPLAVLRMIRAVRARRPDVVQTWMPAGDLLGGLATRFSAIPLVWNLRTTDFEPGRWSWTTRATVKVNAVLSRRWPRRIIAVADRARASHAAIGFDTSRAVVIPNGFDVPKFVIASAAARQTLHLDPRGEIVCRLARYHPDKDFESLFAAWSIVVSKVPTATLALAGDGLETTNPELRSLIERHGVERSVVALGPLANPSLLYAASDLTVSSSLAEGLPNVIGEAMAVGIPAVVTDVGDSAVLVGACGRVVPPSEPEQLAAALVELLSLPGDERRQLGARARERIVHEFSLTAMGSRYLELWSEVAHVRG